MKANVEVEVPDGFTIGDWVIVVQCLDEDGDERLVLRYSDGLSGALQYYMLGTTFDGVRVDQAKRWRSSEDDG